MTDWREELIEKMAKAAWESDGVLNWEGVELGRKIYLLEARAALAVAEPAIREQCAKMAESHNGCEISTREGQWCEAVNEIAAAIREGGREGVRDILERLQGPRTPQGGSWPYPNLHDEAADEITILRGQVEALDNERNRLWTEKLQMQLEITRLNEMVQDAYYKGWQDSASREYSRQEIQKDWETSEVFSALNGEKK